MMLVIVLVTACGVGSQEASNREPLEHTISTQLDAMEKTEEVEKSLQQAAENRRLEIQEQGG